MFRFSENFRWGEDIFVVGTEAEDGAIWSREGGDCYMGRMELNWGTSKLITVRL